MSDMQHQLLGIGVVFLALFMILQIWTVKSEKRKRQAMSTLDSFFAGRGLGVVRCKKVIQAQTLEGPLSVFDAESCSSSLLRIFRYPQSPLPGEKKCEHFSSPEICNTHDYLLAKIGFDTAENEPLKVRITDHTFDHILSVL